MVIALDTGQVADLVFVIEGTANMGAYLGELKANYVIPTLEYRFVLWSELSYRLLSRKLHNW